MFRLFNKAVSRTEVMWGRMRWFMGGRKARKRKVVFVAYLKTLSCIRWRDWEKHENT